MSLNLRRESVIVKTSGMKVLALVPPCRQGVNASRFSFLAEELSCMTGRGVEVHAVSRFVSNPKRLDGVLVHPIPPTRRIMHTFHALGWLSESFGQNGLTLRLGLARTLSTIVSVLRREQIDVIYSPFAWPGETAGIAAARKANVPVVVSLRGADVLVEKDIGYGRMLDRSARNRMQKTLGDSTHVIGISQALVDQGIALGADPANVSVVLKGVDENRFVDGDRLQARLSLGLEDRPTVLFVGNLIRRKGMECLIRAIEIVAREIPNIQLVICGDGPELANVGSAVRSAGLEQRTVLAGRIDRKSMPSYFQACDVFVLPSLTEGAGNVLVEASATARPCIGTNFAGIPDYIDDGETGLLFEKNNSFDLAEKLVTILSDRDLATNMGKAARERVEGLHRYDHMIDQLISIFANVAERRRTLSATVDSDLHAATNRGV